MSGTLTLVGVGPGDPELLTLKAVRLIAAAELVAFPQRPDGGAMARDIAAAFIPATARQLPIILPMAVERGPGRSAYDAGAATLAAELATGRSVVFLCEGDPLFYGSAMYLLTRLGTLGRVAVVPGVTSLTAAAAAIARPLAARNEVLKVLPAPLPDAVLEAELAGTPAVAIIKVGRHFDRVRQVLLRTGHAAGAVMVEHASGPGQAIRLLADVPDGECPYFSTILCYAGDEDWGGGRP